MSRPKQDTGFKSFSVNYHVIVKARTEAEARAKAARKFKKEACRVEELRLRPPPPDPNTHCRHGRLWSTTCDWC